MLFPRRFELLQVIFFRFYFILDIQKKRKKEREKELKTTIALIEGNFLFVLFILLDFVWKMKTDVKTL